MKIKILIILIIAVLATGAAGLIFGYKYAQADKVVFEADGFFLTEAGMSSKKLNFLAGTEYKKTAKGQYTFIDTEGVEQSVEPESFIHYADGTIAALSEGVLVNIDEFKNGSYVNNYKAGTDIVLEPGEDGYSINTTTGNMEFDRVMWKLNDNKYLIAAKNIDITMHESDVRSVNGFVEVEYIEDGIIRLTTDENRWMTISDECGIHADNVFLSLARHEITVNNQIVMHFAQMVQNSNENISLFSARDKQSVIKMPVFDITKEDGRRGVDGAVGEGGETGEIGEGGINGVKAEKGQTGSAGDQGDIGEKGETGTDGSQGDEGNTGDKGDAGDKGITGTEGSEGKSGKPGIIGDNGSAGGAGSAGSAGTEGKIGTMGNRGATGMSGDLSMDDTGNTFEISAVLPSMNLHEFKFSSTSCQGTIGVKDEDMLLTSGMGEIKLINIASNEEFHIEQNVSFGDVGEGGYVFNSGDAVLTPDTQYRLVVSAEYTITGDERVYTKEFITRIFYTDSSGVFVEADYVSDNSVSVKITRSVYSKESRCEVYCFKSPEGRYHFETQKAEGSAVTKVFDTTSSVSVDTGTFYNLNSNTEYTLRYTTTHDGISVVSSDVINIRTLKKRPTVGTPLSIVNRNDGCFDLQLSGLEDPDTGIISLKYYIYEEGSSDYKKVIDTASTSGICSVSCPIGAGDGAVIRTETEYYAIVQATFYDNEKTVYYNSNRSQNFIMNGNFMPTVYFTADTTDAVSAGAIAAEIEKPGVRYNMISGVMVIDGTNLMPVTQNSPLKLIVTAPGDYIFQREITSVNTGAIKYIPVSCTGLKKNTDYQISIWGNINLTGSGGVPEYRLLGTYVQKTPDVTAKLSDAGADIQLIFENTSDESNALSMKLRARSVSDEYLKNSIAEVQVSLFKRGEENQEIGETCIITSKTNTDEIYGYDTLSQLEEGITLTNRDFKVPDNAALQNSSYTMKVTAVYDCTHMLCQQEESDYYKHKNLSHYKNNLISADDDISATIHTQYPPPELPVISEDKTNESVIKVTPILNGNAESYGGAYNSKLTNETMVGVMLESKYNNSSALLRCIKYYVFTKKKYDSFIWRQGVHDPIQEGNYEVEIPITVGNTEVITPKIVLFFGTAPAGVAAKGIQTIGSTKVEYKYVPTLVRGQTYVFAYTCDLNIGGSDASIRTNYYPYQMNNYYSGKAASGGKGESGTVLKRIFEIKKQLPVFYVYPEKSDIQTATWNYMYNDPDKAIAEKTWCIYNSIGTQPEIGTAGSTIKQATFTSLNNGTLYTAAVKCQLMTDEDVPVITPLEVFSFEHQSKTFIDDEASLEISDSVPIKEQLTLNYVRFKLTAKEETLNALAAVKVKLIAKEKASISKTYILIPDSILTPESEGQLYSTEMELTTSNLALFVGNTIQIQSAELLYDGGCSGFGINDDDAYYALERVRADGRYSEYMVPRERGYELMLSDSIRDSIFETSDEISINTNTDNEYSKTIAFKTISMGSSKISADITAAVTNRGAKEAVYSEVVEDNGYLTMKKLKNMKIKIPAGGNVSFRLDTIVPSIVRSTAWVIDLTSISTTYSLSGLNAGDNVTFIVEKIVIDANKNRFYEQLTPNIVQMVSAEGTVSLNLTDLDFGTRYRIKAMHGDNYILNKSGKGIYEEEQQTYTNLQISDQKATYSAADYTSKSIVLKYALNYTSGFTMQYEVYEYNGSRYELTDNYTNLKQKGIINDYASDYIFKNNETAIFACSPGNGVFIPGTKYRIKILAVSTVGGRELISADCDIEIPYWETPVFYVTSAAVVNNDTYGLELKTTVNDPYKIIVNQYYAVRIQDKNGDEVTPDKIRGQYYSSGSKENIMLTGLNPASDYTVSFYAVLDKYNTGGKNDIREISESEIGTYFVASSIQSTSDSFGIKIGNVVLKSNASAEGNFLFDFMNSSKLDSLTEVVYSVSYMSADNAWTVAGNGAVYVTAETFIKNEMVDSAYSFELPLQILWDKLYYITIQFKKDNNTIKSFSTSMYFTH